MAVCPRCGRAELSLGATCPDHPTFRAVRPGQRKDPLLGTVIDRRFCLVAIAGEGGIGRVYEALDQSASPPTTVAVKVLKELSEAHGTLSHAPTKQKYDAKLRGGPAASWN